MDFIKGFMEEAEICQHFEEQENNNWCLELCVYNS